MHGVLRLGNLIEGSDCGLSDPMRYIYTKIRTVGTGADNVLGRAPWATAHNFPQAVDSRTSLAIVPTTRRFLCILRCGGVNVT